MDPPHLHPFDVQLVIILVVVVLLVVEQIHAFQYYHRSFYLTSNIFNILDFLINNTLIFMYLESILTLRSAQLKTNRKRSESSQHARYLS